MKNLFFVIGIILLASFSCNATEMKFAVVDAEQVAQIDRYAEKVIGIMQSNGYAEFGYDEKSVQALSETLTKERTSYSDQAKEVLPVIYGAYLGSAIIKKYGGKWVNVDSFGFGIMIDEYNVVFPLNKVAKHIENGEQDAIYSLYVYANKNKN